MNKNQFLTYFLPIILISTPVFAMEDNQKISSLREDTQEFLMQIAIGINFIPAHETWKLFSANKIKDVVWALALYYNYERTVNFLQMLALKKLVLSENVLQRMIALNYKTANAETIAKTILEAQYVVVEEELETGIVPSTQSMIVESVNFSTNPDKTLSAHNKRHRKEELPTKKSQQPINKKPRKEDLLWQNTTKPNDLFSAREFLNQRFGVITFESAKKNFHCVFRDCPNKNLLNDKKALIRHFKQNHMNKINEVNNNKYLAFTLTPELLARITNYSNDVKPWKRIIQQESL